MTERVYAVFGNYELIPGAIARLLEAGLNREEIEVLGSEPYHGTQGHLGSKTRIPLFAIGAGLAGAVAGALLASQTAKSTMLPTGGMPIVAYAPIGIITFALAGLGAIAGTLMRTLFEARLLSYKKGSGTEELALALASNHFVISVGCQSENQSEEVESLLIRSGSERVTKHLEN